VIAFGAKGDLDTCYSKHNSMNFRVTMISSHPKKDLLGQFVQDTLYLQGWENYCMKNL